MVTFTNTNASVSAKAVDLVTSAFLEVGIFSPEESIPAADAAYGLQKLQRLIDSFNAREELIYNVNFSLYTLQANHQPHTIGPGGDFNVPLRPVEIVAAALVLNNGGSHTDIPLYLADDAWWANIAIKDLTSTLPTAVYYSSDTPLGQLFLWPIPTAVNQLRLETWVNLTQAVNLQTAITMPVGYWNAIITTLALQLCGPYRVSPPETVVADQKNAMQAIEGNNSESPRMSTQQAGMPSRSTTYRPGFNFLTGKPW